MSSIGPDLPPHLLAKRKRQLEEENAPAKEDPPARSPDGSEKRQRVMGPSAPPAPLDERPDVPASKDEDNSDSSDDDYGPSMPTGDAAQQSYNADSDDDTLGPSLPAPAAKEDSKLKRDDWMTLPPTADGLSRNLDPSKRPRQFRSGPAGLKGSSNPGGGMDASWTETPEEKRKRLQDQVMGVGGGGGKREGKSASSTADRSRAKHDEDAAKRIREYNEKHRGQSLFEQQKESKGGKDEDDPSKRAFDREKDIGGTMLGRDAQKELMKKAANFGSKFSGGKYL